jgi:hypothetical protein
MEIIFCSLLFSEPNIWRRFLQMNVGNFTNFFDFLDAAFRLNKSQIEVHSTSLEGKI